MSHPIRVAHTENQPGACRVKPHLTGPVQTVPGDATQASEDLWRPSGSIVLAIASGAAAGDMVGFDSQSIDIGFQSSCDLILQDDEDVFGGQPPELRLQRASDGWTVRQRSGSGLMLNQSVVHGSSPLRSGDIIRLSTRGPDVQFFVQSGGPTVQDLARKYLTESHRSDESPLHRPPDDCPQPDMRLTMAGGKTVPQSHDNRDAPTQSPQHSQDQPPPIRPGDPMRATSLIQGTADRPLNDLRGGRLPSSDPNFGASSTRPAPSLTASAASMLPRKPITKTNNQTTVQTSESYQQPERSWYRPKSWDKKTKDRWIIGAAVLAAVLAFLLYPKSEPSTDQRPAGAMVDASVGFTSLGFPIQLPTKNQ